MSFSHIKIVKPNYMIGGDPQKLNPNRTSIASRLMKESMSAEVVLPRGRAPQFRPSSFPSCPIINWMKLTRFRALGNNENHHYFNMEYYTSVGTTVHEKIQYFMGFTGKLWGHWKCINPDCRAAHRAADKLDPLGNVLKHGKPTRKCSTNNICPRCDEPMLYVEVTVKYRGVTGHIDGIIVMPGNRWAVIDFKTTSTKKVQRGTAAFPEKKHLKQLPFYVYVLEKTYAKKYGYKIDHFSLIYMPRDNPHHFYEHKEKWNSRWRTRCSNLLDDESRKWEAVNHDLESGTFNEIIAAKPCSCAGDYATKMLGYGECPMATHCFNPKRLRSALSQWQEMHESDPPRLQKFEYLVSLIEDREYKAKKSVLRL